MFQVGEFVWVQLRPYRQHSVGKRASNKLARRFYGPFEVVERICNVAYRLQLPAESRIHPMFHFSVLKPFKGDPHKESIVPLPKVNKTEGKPILSPLAICVCKPVMDCR